MPEEHRTAVFKVGSAVVGVRLDVYLARRFGRSRSSVRKRLHNCVSDSGGRCLKWSHIVRSGDKIYVLTPHRPEPDIEVKYQILYSDDWLVVVDKGAGAPVHPSRSYRTRTVLTRLRHQLGQNDINPAHRLDRETSGVLVFGRHAGAVRELMKSFAAGLVRKEYLAVVRGKPEFSQKRVEEPLGRDPGFPISCRMKVDRESGRHSQTDLNVIRRCSDTALVAARPLTGRQHQIRVHLAHIGHPVLGDKLYQEQGRPYLAMIRDELDAETIARIGHFRQALHACSIELPHPATGKILRIEADLPPDMLRLIGDPVDCHASGA